MPQVGGDADRIGLGRQILDARNPADFDIQRQRRAVAVFRQRVLLDQMFRQHGDLVARHIDGGQPRRRQFVQVGARRDAQCRRGDVDADPDRAIGMEDDRKGVIDLGGAGIVDAECRRIARRQIGRRQRRSQLGKTEAAREMGQQKCLAVIFQAGLEWRRSGPAAAPPTDWFPRRHPPAP
jgi:hypothetical protein